MKRFICVVVAALMLLSCAVASADAFTDLYGSFEHVNAVLDRTSNDCTVKPKASAFKAYATDGNVFLPVFARTGDVLMAYVVMQGPGIMFQPRHVMVVTEQYEYRLDLKTEPPMMLNIDGGYYITFLLPSDAIEMCQDIAASSTVTVRFSLDTTHSGTNDFQLSQEVKDLFGAVYEGYMKYDAILDNGVMDRVMDDKAYSYITYKREANTVSMWD